MKRLKIYSLLLFLWITAQTSAQAAGIVFVEGSWKDAIEAAKKANKLLFVDAYADWCGPCKAMAKDVFPQENVGTFYNANFIAYKMDVDSQEGGQVFARYNGSAMPTYLFIDPNNEQLVYKQLGMVPADEFIEIGKKALQMPEFKKKYQAGTLSADEKLNYWVMMEGDPELAADVWKHLEANIGDKLLEPTNFDLMMAYPTDSRSPIFQYFMKNVEKFQKTFEGQTLDYFGGVFEETFQLAIANKDRKLFTDMLPNIQLFKKWLNPDFDMKAFEQNMLEEYNLQIGNGGR